MNVWPSKELKNGRPQSRRISGSVVWAVDSNVTRLRAITQRLALSSSGIRDAFLIQRKDHNTPLVYSACIWRASRRIGKHLKHTTSHTSARCSSSRIILAATVSPLPHTSFRTDRQRHCFKPRTARFWRTLLVKLKRKQETLIRKGKQSRASGKVKVNSKEQEDLRDKEIEDLSWRINQDLYRSQELR